MTNKAIIFAAVIFGAVVTGKKGGEVVPLRKG